MRRYRVWSSIIQFYRVVNTQPKRGERRTFALCRVFIMTCRIVVFMTWRMNVNLELVCHF